MTATLELLASREIAHAFLVADRPADVYQFALDRVTPLLGAAFSLVMQLSDDGELLYPVAQHEWPARHREWIGALRVRVGDGPSGLALAEQRVVEVPDLFADPSLEAWYPVADELGFRSILAAPLVGADGPVGAIAFYFTMPTPVGDEQRALVRLVADQLAATADKASLIDALRRANAALAEANRALEEEARLTDTARGVQNRLLLRLTRVVRQSLPWEDDPWSSESRPRLMDADVLRRRLERGSLTAQAAERLAAIETGQDVPTIIDIDPREPLLLALRRWRALRPTATITHGEPTMQLPSIGGDVKWVERVLFLLIGQVLSAQAGAHPIHVEVELGRGFVAHRVEWFGAPLRDLGDSDIGDPAHSPVEDAAVETSPDHAAPHTTVLDLPLLVAMTRRLGGNLQVDAPNAYGDAQGVTVVFPVEDRGNDPVADPVHLPAPDQPANRVEHRAEHRAEHR